MSQQFSSPHPTVAFWYRFQWDLLASLCAWSRFRQEAAWAVQLLVFATSNGFIFGQLNSKVPDCNAESGWEDLAALWQLVCLQLCFFASKNLSTGLMCWPPVHGYESLLRTAFADLNLPKGFFCHCRWSSKVLGLRVSSEISWAMCCQLRSYLFQLSPQRIQWRDSWTVSELESMSIRSIRYLSIFFNVYQCLSMSNGKSTECSTTIDKPSLCAKASCACSAWRRRACEEFNPQMWMTRHDKTLYLSN